MLQARAFSAPAFVKGQAVQPSIRTALVKPFRAVTVQVSASERLRLNNLSPVKGSRRAEKRKGRGYSAGQGGTCGFGNRGQKCRAGSSVRAGFEGGQTPLYRRLPKLKGIAGGNGAGLPDFVVVNLADLERKFEANEVVTLEKIKEKVKDISGREATLPLKVLGTGELTKPLTVKAVSFSATAAEKIKAAGGTVDKLPGKTKWTRQAYKEKVKELEAKGIDVKADASKKRAARAIARKAREAAATNKRAAAKAH